MRHQIPTRHGMISPHGSAAAAHVRRTYATVSHAARSADAGGRDGGRDDRVGRVGRRAAAAAALVRRGRRRQADRPVRERRLCRQDGPGCASRRRLVAPASAAQLPCRHRPRAGPRVQGHKPMSRAAHPTTSRMVCFRATTGPRPRHICADWARLRHICSGTGLAVPTSAPGSGSPRPHLHRDCARRCHICAGIGLSPPTSAPGPGLSRPHLRRDWAHHTVRAAAQPARTGRGTAAGCNAAWSSREGSCSGACGTSRRLWRSVSRCNMQHNDDSLQHAT